MPISSNTDDACTHRCNTCGPLTDDEVYTATTIDHVPHGDQSVPMESYERKCNHCGREVDDE